MKKCFVLALVLLLLAAAACQGTPAPGPNQTATPGADCTPKPSGDASIEGLAPLLADVQKNYYPGTAGSSLTAARYAGTLLDWFAANRPTSDAIQRVTADFYQTLDPEAAEIFAEEQLPTLYGTAQALLLDTARDYLASAGYEPVSFPWSEQDVTTLFTGLYRGVGMELPR